MLRIPFGGRLLSRRIVLCIPFCISMLAVGLEAADGGVVAASVALGAVAAAALPGRPTDRCRVISRAQWCRNRNI
jgi:hypothetical protein